MPERREMVRNHIICNGEFETGCINFQIGTFSNFQIN